MNLNNLTREDLITLAVAVQERGITLRRLLAERPSPLSGFAPGEREMLSHTLERLDDLQARLGALIDSPRRGDEKE